MKRFGYLCGWVSIVLMQMVFAADDGQVQSPPLQVLKRALYVVKYVRNGGTNNSIGLSLNGCLEKEKDDLDPQNYRALRTCLLGSPVKTGMFSMDETKEETVNWLIPEKNDPRPWGSWLMTHHSTVSLFWDGQHIRVRRQIRGEESEDERPLYVVYPDELAEEQVIEFRWTIYTNGRHALTPISPESSTYVVPAKKKKHKKLKQVMHAFAGGNRGSEHGADAQPSAPAGPYWAQDSQGYSADNHD